MNNSIENIKNQIAINIRERCVYYPSQLMFGKLPGTRYSSQYYMANVLYDYDFMEMVSTIFYEIIKDTIGHFQFQLTGREWSSIPLLTTMPSILRMKHGIELNSFLIRKERKNYGRNNYIEGLPNSLPVLIVDDICNSQNGFNHCNNVLKSEGIETLPYIFSVLNKYFSDTCENSMLHDRYLGSSHKILFVVSGDEVHDRRRS